MSQAYNKTTGNILIPTQNVAASGNVIQSSPAYVSVLNTIGASWTVKFGRLSTTVFTNPIVVRLEGAYVDTPVSGCWSPIDQWSSGVGLNIVGPALNGAGAVAGNAVVPTGTTTSFAIQDIVFIQDPTFANSEWGRAISIQAATSVTLEEGCVRSHAASTSNIWRQAEIYAASIDISMYKYIRAVVDNSNNANACAIQVILNTCDSWG